MKKLFDTQFYIHFRAPNADELISFLDGNNEIDNDVFKWGKNCIVDRIPLSSTPDVVELLTPSMIKLANELNHKGSFFLFDPWINVYNEYSHQEVHEHVRSDMSAVFFMNHGENFSQFYFRDRFSCFLSSDTRRVLKYSDSHVLDNVRAGDIIFFPSNFYHGVNPHKSKEVRKTLSFNFNFEFNDS
jgi:uncharacterized protein (TIGR02466 family)|tara:strand:- start:163 stop:720 length:558 start_codon:yes stop_codon:yes gene_type:complete